jgi:hypothetical protein
VPGETPSSLAIEVIERPGSGSRSRAARMASSVATLGRPHDPAAIAGRDQALVGADDDEFADELIERGEDMEDEPAAGGGGVEVLVQRGEADPAVAQFGNHVDEVLETAVVAVQARGDEGVAGVEEGVARLQLGAERGLAGLLVREDPPAPGGGERVELPLQLLPAGRDSRVPDLDLGADEGFGDEEARLGRFESGHDHGSCQKTVGWGY